MPFTQQEIDNIKKKALAQGYTEQQIASSIAGFSQDSSAQAPAQSSITPTDPNAGGIAAKTVQQSQNASGEDNKVGDFFKSLFSAADRFGTGLGNATDAAVGSSLDATANIAGKVAGAVTGVPGTADVIEGKIKGAFGGLDDQSIIAQNQKTSDDLMNLADAARAKGDKVGAAKLLQYAREVSARNQDISQSRIDQATKGTEDVVKGGVGTAAYFIPGGDTPGGKVFSSAVQGGFGGYANSKTGNELVDATKGAAIGAAADLAFQGAGKVAEKVLGKSSEVGNRVINKMLNPFVDQYDESIVRLAEEKGVDLPLSAKTSSNFVKQTEALAQKSIFGGEITQNIVKARDQVNTLAQNITDDLVKPENEKNVGKIIQDGFSQFENNFNTTKTELYNKIPESVNTAEAVTSSTQDILNKIKERRGQSAVPNQSSFFEDISKNLFPQTENASGQSGLFGEAASNASDTSKVTYQTLKQTRTDIIEKLKNFNDPVATGNKSDLKALVAALSDDIEQTVKNVDPNAYEVMQNANTFYREGLQKINSKVGVAIKNLPPEKLVDVLVKPNSETNIALAMSVLPPESQDALKEGFLNKMMNDSVNAKTGFLDGSKLQTQVKKYGLSSIQQLVGEEGVSNINTVLSNLDDINKLQKAISSGVKAAEGSQTSFLLKTADSVGSLGLLLVSPQAALAKYAAQFGGQYGISKALSNEGVQKLLTEGLGEIAQKGGVQLNASIPDIVRSLTANYLGSKAGQSDIASPVQASTDASGNTVDTSSTSTNGTTVTNSTASTQLPGSTTAFTPKATDTAVKPQEDNSNKPFGGKSKNEIIQLALARGANLKNLKEISDIYDLVSPESQGKNDVDTLVARREKLLKGGFDTTNVDLQLADAGYKLNDTKNAPPKDLVTQISAIDTAGERNGARATKDILDVVNTAIEKSQGVSTGPLAAIQAKLSKLTGPNKTAQLEKDLSEILRTIRKESTGVAYSPQEIIDLEKEIPTIAQQEGNVQDSLARLKQRMLQKLSNYGVDVSAEMSKDTPTK